MEKKFIDKITNNWQLKCEFNHNCQSIEWLKASSYDEIIKMFPKKENLFFINWVKDTNQNRNKSNIEYVNRITIDIDLRKNSKEWDNLDITDEEIIEIAKELWEHLKIDRPDDFWQWSFIMTSWNGIHIHYFWKPLKVEWVDFADIFQATLTNIYNEFTNYMWSPYEADTQVWDLWHLFRIPWTWNIKNWEKHKCEIVLFQDVESNFVNQLPKLMELSTKKISFNKKILEKKNNEKQINKKIYTNQEDVWEFIRKKVDVAQVLLKFIPERQLLKDGIHFKKPWKSWYNSYYVDKEWWNYIHRWWSTFLAWNKDWMNPLDIVEAYTWLKWKELLNWFVDNKFITLNKYN